MVSFCFQEDKGWHCEVDVATYNQIRSLFKAYLATGYFVNLIMILLLLRNVQNIAVFYR